jgi:signal transduction histidine kinase
VERIVDPPQVDRRIVRTTRGFFYTKSTALVVVVGVAFIAVVAVLDYLTGPSLSLSLLYLMPIGLVTWNLGRRWGAAAVILATAAGIVADVAANPVLTTNDPVPYWNAIVRFAVFMAFAMLMDTLRAIIEAQWAQVETEAGRAGDLSELNAAKNTLLHAVSHDLKNPLAGIIGAMQTIRRDDELHLSADERESLYEVIEQSGHKMNRLIDDLLDLDRIDRGKLHPRRQPTDVGALAERLVRESHGLETHPVRIEADPVLVDVDIAKVERVIDNLLINAARHTPPGTPVHIAVTARADGVELAVEDEGAGVPDDLKQELFEPFRQGATSGGRGVGIGLSLVQRFAELHGGSARIEDGANGGARFVVWLPGAVTARPEPAEEEVTAARASAPAEEEAQLHAV